MRLTVSDGVNSSLSTPLTITVGSPPTATISSPTDGHVFRAGDVINLQRRRDRSRGRHAARQRLSRWNIDFLHDNHVHPGTADHGREERQLHHPDEWARLRGQHALPHQLTVTDSHGLQDTKSVTVWPDKVNLPFDTSPSGLTLYVDGVARTTPFVLDTLVGFNHTIEARDQTSGNNSYTFSSWSDGGAQTPHDHGAERSRSRTPRTTR